MSCSMLSSEYIEPPTLPASICAIASSIRTRSEKGGCEGCERACLPDGVEDATDVPDRVAQCAAIAAVVDDHRHRQRVVRVQEQRHPSARGQRCDVRGRELREVAAEVGVGGSQPFVVEGGVGDPARAPRLPRRSCRQGWQGSRGWQGQMAIERGLGWQRTFGWRWAPRTLLQRAWLKLAQPFVHGGGSSGAEPPAQRHGPTKTTASAPMPSAASNRNQQRRRWVGPEVGGVADLPRQ